MVPNLEIILQTVSSSYKILVKFLGGQSVQAQKVKFFKVILLQNRENLGVQTFRNLSQDHNIALNSKGSPKKKLSFTAVIPSPDPDPYPPYL